MTNPFLDAALGYVARGWQVFPLAPRSKEPMKGSHGHLDATTDEATIREWWAKTPDANVGVATGAVSVIAVLDVDPRHGGDGSLAKLNGHIPRTKTAKTGGGGRHLVFKHPGGLVKSSASEIAPGLDVKGDGGYIVAPPSIHPSGAPYEWDGDTPLAEWPFAAKTKGPSAPRAADKISDGERNAALTSLAGSMRRRGMSEEAIVAALQVENETRCRPPLPRHEVAGIARSVASYPALEGAREPVTIEWAARQFVQKNRHEARYVHEAERWFFFDGTRWTHDETLEMERRTKALFHRFRIEGAARDDKILEAFGLKLDSQKLRTVLHLSRSDDSISGRYSDFDRRDRCEFLFNVANGTIDLRTGILRPHDRSDFISKISPVRFDPGATCPRFDRFLREVFDSDEDLVGYFWRFLGYALTASVREHCFWIFYGVGANGKSTLIVVIAALLGDYATSTAVETFTRAKWERNANENTPALARLRGARFVSAVEPKETATIDESVVKAIVGGDVMVACRKYENPFEFEPEAKVFIAVNNPPRIRDASEGMWRRVRLLAFPARFEGVQRDLTLVEKLKAELPGILKRAVQGCLEWQRIGLAEPPSVLAATEGYRTQEDTIGRFLAEETERGGRVSGADLFARYESWCKGEGEEPLKSKGFGQALTRRQVRRKKTHGQVFREGIHLIPGAMGDSVTGHFDEGAFP